MEKEIQKLRSKDECEQQLAVELSIGAVESIDSLINHGHEVACEYACQLLFESMRKQVAQVENLPSRIVQHLLKDPCQKVRLAIIESNWKTLTPEQQEEVIVEAEQLHDDKSVEKGEYYSHQRTKYRALKSIIRDLLTEALHERKEPEALRYIKMIGAYDGLPKIEKGDLLNVLKDMPKIFQVYWKSVNSYYHRQDTILVHPDEKIRMAEVERILKKETRVAGLKDWKDAIGNASTGETLKGNILQLWVNDPSENIRRLIAMTTTSVSVLEMLVSDESNTIRQIAYPRYKKFQKRAEYSKKYQVRKKEKLRMEEREAYLKRGF